MTDFTLAGYNLDDLRRYCHVAEIGRTITANGISTVFKYLIIYGRMIAGPSHIAVVQVSEKPYGLCYFCAYDTSGRVVLENEQRLVREILVCCRYCYDIGRDYQGTGGLVTIGHLGRRARYKRQGFAPAASYNWVKIDARNRAKLFPGLIEQARALDDWPEEPPPIPWKAYFRWFATADERVLMREELMERRRQRSAAAVAQLAAENGQAVRPQRAATLGRQGEVDYIDAALERWSA